LKTFSKIKRQSSPTNSPPSTSLSIYPNPAKNSFTLKIPTQDPAVFVTLTDHLGRELSRQTISTGPNDSAELDILALPTGMYQVTATTPSGQVFLGKVLTME